MNCLLIDNYDSFTHMLADYVRQCGVTCDVIRNDNLKLLEDSFMLNYQALILSPGPQTPVKAGYLMQIIEKYHHQLPLLGVCLGHQAIGEFFGANLVKAISPKHGKIDKVVHHTPSRLLKGMPDLFQVTRYHSLVLHQIKSPLLQIAHTLEMECMALEHKELPIFGVQFHPESCLTDNGIKIIKNFLHEASQVQIPIK